MVSDGADSGGLGPAGGVLTGARIAGYRLEEQIGRGGMAVVFRAVDERLGRQAAVKVLSAGLAEEDLAAYDTGQTGGPLVRSASTATPRASPQSAGSVTTAPYGPASPYGQPAENSDATPVSRWNLLLLAALTVAVLVVAGVTIAML